MFPETPEEVKALEESWKREAADAESWRKLVEYLHNELADGQIAFRIAFQDSSHFIVHPLGKDGKTIDIYLACTANDCVR
jgi:hypothetical protein